MMRVARLRLPCPFFDSFKQYMSTPIYFLTGSNPLCIMSATEYSSTTTQLHESWRHNISSLIHQFSRLFLHCMFQGCHVMPTCTSYQLPAPCPPTSPLPPSPLWISWWRDMRCIQLPKCEQIHLLPSGWIWSILIRQQAQGKSHSTGWWGCKHGLGMPLSSQAPGSRADTGGCSYSTAESPRLLERLYILHLRWKVMCRRPGLLPVVPGPDKL